MKPSIIATTRMTGEAVESARRHFRPRRGKRKVKWILPADTVANGLMGVSAGNGYHTKPGNPARNWTPKGGQEDPKRLSEAGCARIGIREEQRRGRTALGLAAYQGRVY